MNNIEYYEQMSAFKKFDGTKLCDLTDEDKCAMTTDFIQFIRKIIASDKKYWIYLSIGGSYTEESDSNQLFPELNYKEDYEALYIGIDNFSRINKEQYDNYNMKDHIFLFNMYWLDNYQPLLKIMRELIQYNIQKSGVLICGNFCRQV